MHTGYILLCRRRMLDRTWASATGFLIIVTQERDYQLSRLVMVVSLIPF